MIEGRTTALLISVTTAAALVLLGSGCQKITPSNPTQPAIRVGYFANINHAPALVGMANGAFQRALGNNTVIQTKVFNAGPAAVEAIFAGALDITYIGPTPAMNGFFKSQGQALRIISGVTSGGASLLLQNSLAEEFKRIGPSALKGKTIATPQQGNTQDIALRHYVREQGLSGSITILPMANADQINAFRQKQIDGSWAPEPWATRLAMEAEGVRAMDERERWTDGAFPSAVIVVNRDFLTKQPEMVKDWLRAHVETVAWMNKHPQEAQTLFNEELKKITSAALSKDLLAEAWQRLVFTTDPLQTQTQEQTQWAKEEGFLSDENADAKDAYDLTLLNDVTHQPNQ